MTATAILVLLLLAELPHMHAKKTAAAVGYRHVQRYSGTVRVDASKKKSHYGSIKKKGSGGSSVPPVTDLVGRPYCPRLNWSTALDGAWYKDTAGHYAYELDACRLRRLSQPEALRCIADTGRIEFVGDSLTRYQYVSLVYFLTAGHYQHPYDDSHHSVTWYKQWQSWGRYYKGVKQLLQGMLDRYGGSLKNTQRHDASERWSFIRPLHKPAPAAAKPRVLRHAAEFRAHVSSRRSVANMSPGQGASSASPTFNGTGSLEIISIGSNSSYKSTDPTSLGITIGNSSLNAPTSSTTDGEPAVASIHFSYLRDGGRWKQLALGLMDEILKKRGVPGLLLLNPGVSGTPQDAKRVGSVMAGVDAILLYGVKRFWSGDAGSGGKQPTLAWKTHTMDNWDQVQALLLADAEKRGWVEFDLRTITHALERQKLMMQIEPKGNCHFLAIVYEQFNDVLLNILCDA